MYDDGLRVTNLTCVGIDHPGRKAVTLSVGTDKSNDLDRFAK